MDGWLAILHPFQHFSVILDSVSPRNKKGHGKFSQKRALKRMNLGKKGTAKKYLLYVVAVLL